MGLRGEKSASDGFLSQGRQSLMMANRIHVNAICPGFSETAMTQQLFDSPEIKQALIGGHGFGDRLGEPEDVARACVFLASADARWVTGMASFKFCRVRPG